MGRLFVRAVPASLRRLFRVVFLRGDWYVRWLETSIEELEAELDAAREAAERQNDGR